VAIAAGTHAALICVVVVDVQIVEVDQVREHGDPSGVVEHAGGGHLLSSSRRGGDGQRVDQRPIGERESLSPRLSAAH